MVTDDPSEPGWAMDGIGGGYAAFERDHRLHIIDADTGRTKVIVEKTWEPREWWVSLADPSTCSVWREKVVARDPASAALQAVDRHEVKYGYRPAVCEWYVDSWSTLDDRLGLDPRVDVVDPDEWTEVAA